MHCKKDYICILINVITLAVLFIKEQNINEVVNIKITLQVLELHKENLNYPIFVMTIQITFACDDLLQYP